MRTLAKFVLAAGMLTWTSVSYAADLQFDGETFVKRFTSNTPEIRLVEYVRENETLENWTKLVAVRNFTKLNDPKRAAAGLGLLAKQRNPLANFQVLVKDDDESQAQVDFITWPKDSAYMEFNIHRYMKVERYPGLISYQFAYRLRDMSPEPVEKFKKDRHRWIAEMFKAKFPIDFTK
jgi:hypothetical protein